MEDSMRVDGQLEVEVIDIGIEAKFAETLAKYERGELADTFDLVKQFRDCASTKAIQIRDQLYEDEQIDINPQFEAAELETKLWHLTQELYSFRLSNIDPQPETKYSSDATKEFNFRTNNRPLTELYIIRNWIQYNSEEVDTSSVPFSSKWRNTKLSLDANSLNVLATTTTSYITELDSDAPLRLDKRIHPDDSKTDEEVFKVLYKLIINDKCDEAITLANETANYSLSIILVGHIQHYLDTDDISTFKHKLMWYQTVYKLSQQKLLNKYEKLIYNYLSGSNILENLQESITWEENLLLYCNQVIVYETVKFYQKLYQANTSETLDIIIPRPQMESIDLILNALSRSESAISIMSKHPIRIMSGGIMIKKILPLITDTVKNAGSGKIYENTSLLRILVHLSIFIYLIDAETIDSTDFTKLIITYIKKLTELNLKDLVPIYLSFIPKEADAIECFSDFLSTITPKEEKVKQIQICKRYGYFTSPINNSGSEERLSIILKKTVEKILRNTESHYRAKLQINIEDQPESIDETDKMLYQSVDWLIANSMHEDTIMVSLVIIKRFLICGKLAALKEFAKEKNFKLIVNSYDNELSTRKFNSDKLYSPIPVINDDDREELLNYDFLIQGLNSITEWKKFIEDNGKDKTNFKSKGVEHSIDKITKQLNTLIMKWFTNTTNNMLTEFRRLYIPYLVIELLKIYEFSRYNNMNYLNKSFELIKLVANEDENDLLNCFVKSDKLNDFLKKCGEVALIASENEFEEGIYI